MARPIVLSLLLVAACGSSSPSSPDAGPQRGSLSITISGVVSGDAIVTVSGPNGYREQVAATTTLPDLAPGTYTIAAAAIRLQGTFVDRLEDGTVSAPTVDVAAGGTATTSVAYAVVPWSGQLWFPELAVPGLAGWTDAALANPAGTTGHSAITLAWPDGSSALQPQDFAFDGAGALWSTVLEPGTGNTNNGSQRIAAWSPATFTDGATVQPAVVLGTMDTGGGVPSLDSPLALAFDADGDLWVGNCGWITGHATLVAFAPASLASSGAPAPAKLTTAPGCPEGLSFDAAGNLWLVDNSPDVITRYPVAELAKSAPAADLTIHLAKPYDYPTASVFDQNGNLWVAECGTFVGVTAYTPTQLAAGADVDPAIALTSTSWVCPVGLAFDNVGNLWVEDNNSPTDGTITQIAPAQLAASGDVTAAATIRVQAADWSWGGLAFYPQPLLVPLH